MLNKFPRLGSLNLQNKFIGALAFGLLLTLNACVYKMDIHQGNILEDTQIAQLEAGMAKTDVISLLGTPQLIDPFHSERWDYFSSSNTNNQRDKEKGIITLVFEDEKLAQIIQH